MQGIGTGDKDGKRVQGTNTMFFINKKNIPPDRMTTYARFVCTYRAEKEEKNRTRLTVGGNLITDYEGDVTTDTAGLELIKNALALSIIYRTCTVHDNGYWKLLSQHNTRPI